MRPKLMTMAPLSDRSLKGAGHSCPASTPVHAAAAAAHVDLLCFALVKTGTISQALDHAWWPLQCRCQVD